MLKSLLAIVAAALMVASLGAEARSMDDIIRDGTLRVGVNPNFPPMSSYGRTNQLEGFDIEVANAIAAALGVNVRLVPTETAQRVAFLTSGRIDIALGALTRTPERARLIDFTVPLHTESMGVLTTDKLDITNWEDLNSADYTLVNMRGNWSVGLLAEKLPESKVLLVDGNADTVRALAQGRADALVENIDFFINFTKNYRNVTWRTLLDPIFVAHCSIGLAKNNHDLRQFLNIVLYDLHSSGAIGEMWEKWFGAPMSVPVEPQPFF